MKTIFYSRHVAGKVGFSASTNGEKTMNRVYICECCGAIGKYKVENCPKCRGYKILEIPFDGKWVLVKDPECRRRLQLAYEMREVEWEMGR